MAMQITPEQTDWLTRFLGKNIPEMTPEMAINTAGDTPRDNRGQAAAPGIFDRFDAAVNGVGESIFGSAGRVAAPGGAATLGPETPPASAPAQPAAPEPGFFDRMESAVNGLGESIFGSVGRVAAPSGVATAAPQTPPPSAPAQEAAPEPGIFDRMESAMNDFGASIFGSAGQVE